MPIRVLPNVLTLQAQGFLDDPWVRDGVHARWFVAPGFGLPRSAFRFAFRPALGATLPADVGSQTRSLTSSQVVSSDGAFLRFDGLAVRGESFDAVSPPDFGLPPTTDGYRLFFSDPDGRATQAVWLRLTFQVLGQGTVHAIALDEHDGIVDRSRTLGDPSLRGGSSVTLTVRGVMTSVRIGCPQARVTEAEWVTGDAYANAGGWKDSAFRLPLVPSDTPNYEASENGLSAARTRLMGWRAKADGPAHAVAIPPTGGPPTDAALEARVVAPYLAFVRDWLKVLFDASGGIPQADVVVPHAMQVEGQDATLNVPVRQLIDMLALDPDVARFLGLGAFVDLSSAVDLLVFADLESSDVSAHLQGDMALLAGGSDQLRVGALAMGLTKEVVERPSKPSRPGLRWQNPAPPTSTDAAQVRFRWRPVDEAVAYVVRRSSGEGSLVRPDGGRELVAPNRTAKGHAYVDDFIPDFGKWRYRVAARDLWGSWSDWAKVKKTLTDPVAPPAPVHVRATLDGALGEQKLVVEWDWYDTQAEQAPDLSFFRVYVRQGAAEGGPDARSPSAWKGVELSPGTVTKSPKVNPDTGVAPGFDASVLPAKDPETGSAFRRYRVAFSVEAPFDIDGVARMTATVGAVDDAKNQSDPVAVPSVARGVDRSPPPTVELPPLVHASIGDALSESYHVVRWDRHVHTSYDVFVASERDIQRVHPEAVLPSESLARAEALRKIAPTVQRAFRSAFVEPIGVDRPPGASLEARLGLPARSRSLYVCAVVGRSVAGTPGPWPDKASSFTVIQIPDADPPGPPALVRVTPDEAGGVELQVQLDKTRAATRIHVYRTLHAAKAENASWMRPLRSVDVADWPEPGEAIPLEMGTLEHLAPSGSDPATIQVTLRDPSLGPWRRAWYRVVAEGRPVAGMSRGTLSEASSVASVRTRWGDPPPRPTRLSVRERLGKRFLVWRADVPLRATVPGPYEIRVQRRAEDGSWSTVGITNSGPDLADSFERKGERWRFMLPPKEGEWRVRLTDPIGRLVLSTTVGG